MKTNHDIFINSKDDYDEALSIDWTDARGKGSYLQDMARRALSAYALHDGFNTQEMGLAVVEMVEVVSLLDDHQDDYVAVAHQPDGSWQLTEGV